MSNIFLPFGRMRRIHYAFFSIVFAILWLLVGWALGAAFNSGNPSTAFIVLPFLAALTWPQYNVGIQRAHDIGSIKYVFGWNIFILFCIIIIGGAFKTVLLPDYSPPQYVIDYGAEEMLMIGLILLLTLILMLSICWLNLMLLVVPGEAGTNRYGKDPRPESERMKVSAATDGPGQADAPAPRAVLAE